MDGIKKSPRLIFSKTKAPGPGWPIPVTVNGVGTLKIVTHEGLNYMDTFKCGSNLSVQPNPNPLSLNFPIYASLSI